MDHQEKNRADTGLVRNLLMGVDDRILKPF